MAYKLIDFADLYVAIAAELKLQLSDTTNLNRIKRVVNMVYLDEVAPEARWWWLQGHAVIKHKISYSDGTCAITPNTTTVTISVAPSVTAGDAGSFVGWYFSVDGQNEIYRISEHTAGATTFTLDTPYNGNLITANAYKIYQENIPLPTDCRETVEVYYDHMGTPLVGKGLQEFRKIQTSSPKTIGRPNFYCTYDFQDPTPNTVETEADRYRILKVWPAISQYTTLLKVDYIKEVPALDLDGDEPLMPIEDRIVLYYGALSILWSSIGRNPEESARNKGLYDNKLARMMGKITDSMDKPRVEPDSSYVVTKRGPRIGRYGRAFAGPASSGGSTYNAPSYLENVTINGATITANVGVNPGVTIDGRDISADGLTLDSHIASIGNVHGAVGGIVGLDNAQVLTNKTIDASGNTISNIADSSISASAAISTSKLAPLTANKALTTGSSGLLEVSATTASELAQLSGIASNVQTQLNANSTAISDHITDTSAAHSASSVSNVPSGNLAATDVQGALNELQSDIDTRATISALSAHTTNTSNPHSVTKAQVGLSNVDNTSDATKNSAAVVLTNKDIDGGTASDTSRITLPKAAKTTLDALTRKQGTLVYDTTTNKPYYDDGTFLKVIGSGSGGSINFISGGDAESGTTGITPYNEGSSASRPSAGTGTAPTGITLSTDSTNPLSGTNSFILSKSAVNARGQGYSWGFTIDRAYQAKVLKIEMDYVVSSGSFVAGTPTTDSDLIVYIIDVDSGKAIEPSSFKFLSNSTTISDRFSATFQASATSLNYRLCLHVANNTTNTWQIKFDNLAVSPSNYVYGTPITDWQSYTPSAVQAGTTAPTVTWNDTNICRWRQVGDSMEVTINLATTSVSNIGSGTYFWPLPDGYSIDSTKVATLYDPAIARTDRVPAVGVGSISGNGATAGWTTELSPGAIVYPATLSGNAKYLVLKATSNGTVVGSTNYALATTGFFNYTLRATVPILGWSSSVQVSDGYDGRVIAARAYSSATQPALTTSYSPVNWATPLSDSTGSFGSNFYTIQSAGFYSIEAQIATNGTGALNSFVATGIYNATTSTYIAETSYNFGGAISNGILLPISITSVYLPAGTRLEIHGKYGGTYTGGAYSTGGAGYFTITKLAGNPVISATETVAMNYTGAPPTGTLTNNTTQNTIFGTRRTDTNGIYNTTTGIATIPVAGYYTMQFRTRVNGTFSATGDSLGLIILNITTGTIYGNNVPPLLNIVLQGSVLAQAVWCNAGDQIRTQVYVAGSGTGLNYIADSSSHEFSIVKVK